MGGEEQVRLQSIGASLGSNWGPGAMRCHPGCPAPCTFLGSIQRGVAGYAIAKSNGLFSGFNPQLIHASGGSNGKLIWRKKAQAPWRQLALNCG